MQTIVILGGSFAGVGTAHRILKQTSKTRPSVKIVIVSPNTHMYWNIAAPRAMLPGQFTDEKIFQPIAAGFKQYSANQFEFISGSARSLDPVARKVEVSTGPREQETVIIDYDFLIIGTGSRNKADDDDVNIPFKALGSTDATKNALHILQAVVKKSKRIVIVGAGPTGIETAGELAFEYGKEKEIILIASGQTVLEGAIPSVSKTALGMLQKLNVDIRLRTKVTSSTRTTRGGVDQVELSLSDGTELTADICIPTFGVLPNSSYIPSKYLDANGFVKVDEYFQVKGLENQHVWAIGDVSNLEPPQALFVDKQSAHLAKNIVLILSNKAPIPYKEATRGKIISPVD
ncbi:NAD(P)/FAD-dependent oxidoreductase [Aspergillus tanneri]|uniref:FAD/NAD(P)-binding domain-containing protein n=1 Tax=Aspergillus tanneri TaxID=1220188 RepID=A0A5M9NDP7_9EURO|nr:uncharacterized protein ATNIH1004_001806 [Aspergillus tanneri]KAA8652897.1 hypothetical protein ATNIH1004_001806 [Aspergillus tanneri]